VPAAVLAAEKARTTLRGRMLARTKRKAPKVVAEPVRVDEYVPFGELLSGPQDDLTAKLRAARRRVAA
jgi:hypothetical protein